MYHRIIHLPLTDLSSIFLFGPRGTGKTSLVKQLLPDAIYLDLLDFSLYKTFLANPNRLKNFIPQAYNGWIVIDEVQRVPELLNEVHRLIENSNNNYRFLLTGSSARSLKRKGVNLLAGRALRYVLHPFIAQELLQDFNLAHALNYGLLPKGIKNSYPERYLESYIQTYLREEVLQEGLTRNLSAFSRFLEIASFSQGSQLNYSEIAREVAIDRQVVVNYFSILEDLLIAYRLSPFTKRAKRRLTTHTKFYFFDTGVYRFLRPKGILDYPEQIDGVALETLFFQSIKAINDYYYLGFNIYFWRTAEGQEVDFVLYGEKGLFAFEIKRSTHVTIKMLAGLKAFKRDYPLASLFLLYTGSISECIDNIQIIPLEQALKQLPQLLLQ